MLGSNLIELLPEGSSFVALSRSTATRNLNFEAIDLSIESNRHGLLERFDIDCVINCAAITSIEACEQNLEMAESLNFQLPRDLAAQAAIHGKRFIQISTDAVFDGQKGGYKESDKPNPENVYGRLKSDAEMAVLDINPNASVVRTNFFGWSPSGVRSIAEFFLNRLTQGLSTPGFTDAIVSFTDVDLLAKRIFKLAEIDHSGLLHIGSSEAVSKFRFAKMLAIRFSLDSNLIQACSSDSILRVMRGKNLSLNTAASEAILGMRSPTQMDGIESLHASKENGRQSRLRGLTR